MPRPRRRDAGDAGDAGNAGDGQRGAAAVERSGELEGAATSTWHVGDMKIIGKPYKNHGKMVVSWDFMGIYLTIVECGYNNLW